MAFYAFLSPMILARVLSAQDYSAYIVGLQVVPFLLLMCTPVQAALSPKFARYRTEVGEQSRETLYLISTATRYFFMISLTAIAASFLLSYLLPIILAWDPLFVSSASPAVRYLGIAAAISMPALVFTSYAAGNQNFFWENILKCLGPYLGLTLVLIVWKFSVDFQDRLPLYWVIGLSVVSTVLAAIVIICAGLMQPIASKICWLQTSKFGIDELRREVAGSYWINLCALLTLSTGTFIVSRVDSNSVAAYAIAASTMSIISGIASAVAGPFSIRIAQNRSSSPRECAEIFKIFHDRFVLFIFISTITLLAIPQFMFNLWLGDFLGNAVKPFILPLALANFLRQLTAPYTMAVFGLGQQSRLWLSPMIEAVLAIFFGVILGNSYGPHGVAYGIFIAASMRLLVTIFYDLKITYAHLPLLARHLLVLRLTNFFKFYKK